jgi:hypothetical protein
MHLFHAQQVHILDADLVVGVNGMVGLASRLLQ